METVSDHHHARPISFVCGCHFQYHFPILLLGQINWHTLCCFLVVQEPSTVILEKPQWDKSKYVASALLLCMNDYVIIFVFLSRVSGKKQFIHLGNKILCIVSIKQQLFIQCCSTYLDGSMSPAQIILPTLILKTLHNYGCNGYINNIQKVYFPLSSRLVLTCVFFCIFFCYNIDYNQLEL